MVPPDSDRAPPTPPYSGYSLGSSLFRVRGCHPLRPAFPGVFPYMPFFHIGCPTTPRAPRRPRFGLAPFRSPLLGGSLLFSSPPPTWMFRFGGFAPAPRRVPRPRAAGCPIRAPADQRQLAPPRGLSRPAAPFIASGSHRHPPCALSRLTPRQRTRPLPRPGVPVVRVCSMQSMQEKSLLSSATDRRKNGRNRTPRIPPMLSMNTRAKRRGKKWRMWDSNPRPPACKAGAPAS